VIYAALFYGVALFTVAGAFGVPDPARVKGLHIGLVDDVYTSGATTAACTAALLRAGAASVTILCWARVIAGRA